MKRTVLVVDDEQNMQAVMRMILVCQTCRSRP